MSNKLKIIYMGTPEFAVAPLKALLEAGYEIPAVVTVPDKPKGRGLQMSQSDVKKFVLERNSSLAYTGCNEGSDICVPGKSIDILQPEKLRDAAFLQQLESYGADLFIVVAFRMLPEAVWKMPKLGTFNLHASLLPKFRGAAPINWAIIQREKETGVTTFFIDEKIDTGNILLQEKTTIDERETVETLHDRLMEMGSSLVVKTVQSIDNNSITPHPQDDTSLTPELAQAPKLNKQNCRLDFSKTVEEADALARGLSPYPSALATLQTGSGERIEMKIFSTELAAQNSQCTSDVEYGKATIKDKGIYVQCKNGVLKITSLQPAGKKRMGAIDFINGHKSLTEDNSLFFI